MIKKAASALAVLVFVAVVIEALSYGVYYVKNDRVFTFSHAALMRDAALQRSSEVSAEKLLQGYYKVLHPYLGYVYNAEKRDFLHAGLAISDFGFPDDNSLIQKKSPDKLIIGVLGGSVAWWFQSLGYDALSEELAKVPQLRGKRIELVRMALGGYKQPQQLLAYNYALSLGGEFDILISIDGYNEVGLYAPGSKVNPVFPHEWQLLASSTVDPDTISHAGRIATLRDLRSGLAASLNRSLIRSSVSANLVWQYLDSCIAGSIAKARRAYAERQAPGRHLRYQVSGPPFPEQTPEAFFNRLADVWANSSLVIHNISSARGSEYFHFLQPNQYVKDSKKEFTEFELETAYLPEQAPRFLSTFGYPALIEAGKRLQEQGVNYHDLTKLFHNERRSMYEDSCCHLSELGNEVMGRAIGAAIAERFLQKAGKSS